jgi:hypothetical protein
MILLRSLSCLKFVYSITITIYLCFIILYFSILLHIINYLTDVSDGPSYMQHFLKRFV